MLETLPNMQVCQVNQDLGFLKGSKEGLTKTLKNSIMNCNKTIVWSLNTGSVTGISLLVKGN